MYMLYSYMYMLYNCIVCVNVCSACLLSFLCLLIVSVLCT